jgi:hypothetical protein
VKEFFSQLLNIHGVNIVRQTEIYTAEPPVPDSSAFDYEMVVEELQRHRLQGLLNPMKTDCNREKNNFL